MTSTPERIDEQIDPAGDPAGDLDIAIVGMAGRFPGAADLDRFWRNIRDGVCSVSRFDDDELRAAGVNPRVRDNPAFVPAGFVLDGVDRFDAALFGYSPREAELIDPQHRLLLETAWQALDDAGHDPSRAPELVGVYAGCGSSSYLMFNIATHPQVIEKIGGDQVMLGNRPDFLASRVSYKLGLEGPSIDVQSACSSSLVAVALACQGLLSYQCDVALAGGVSVDVLRRQGYTYQPDGLFSPDGVCRTFDARAQGTVGGDGVGMVALKRLSDALAVGDHIRAVVKGSALNNDGAARAGFTAPRADGQALVVTTALATAGVEPADIGYLEAHGTATVLGDPIEVAGLTAAFAGVPAGSCALGSVKPNIGHLDAAAGVAGLIKTVLCLENRVIPPLPNYERPNPRIDFGAGPFYVPTAAEDWADGRGLRRAGVSSFGLGGTNAHVVLEQAPDRPGPAARPETQLLLLSARGEAELDAATEQLADALRVAAPPAIADVAHTLQTGRRAFPVRRALVCRSAADARDVLDDRTDPRLLTATTSGPRPVAFLFTGFGESYAGMGRELYAEEPAFRAALDECAELYAGLLADRAPAEQADLRTVLFEADDEDTAATPAPPAAASLVGLFDEPTVSDHPLADPVVGYPALFALEYALAQLWRSRGIEPDAMAGHSLGEYVAACLAGVFSLLDAMGLVLARGEMLAEQCGGAMLGVPLPETQLERFVDGEVGLAAVNGPRTCVLSGPTAAIDRVARVLRDEGNASRRVATRHAFHSPMTEPVVEPYRRLVAGVRLSPPRRRFLSNVTGTWITDAQATDPAYWSRHLREPVRFADCLAVLWREEPVLLEIGPGRTLTSLALQHPGARAARAAAAATSLPARRGEQPEREHQLDARARLWLAGVELDWAGAVGGPACPVPLPSYPFERQRYWLDARPDSRPLRPGGAPRSADPQSWFSTPTWRRAAATGTEPEAGTGRWLVLADRGGLADALIARLDERGGDVVRVLAGPADANGADRADGAVADGRTVVLDAADPAAWAALARRLADTGMPDRLVHLWGMDADPGSGADPGPDVAPSGPAAVDAVVARTFGSLVGWLQAAEPALATDPPRWDVVTCGAVSVLGDEPVNPGAAAALGLARVVPQEYPGLRMFVHDLPRTAHRTSTDRTSTDRTSTDRESAADELVAALLRDDLPAVSAVRGRHRWVPGHEPATLRPAADRVLADGDTYLITGGLGKIGLTLAHGIASRVRARFVLVGRHGVTTDEQKRAVATVEALGAEVLVLTGDVADEQRLREVVRQATERFGPIHGVLHAAGSTGPAAHRVLAELDDAQLASHMRPKLHGMLALDTVLAEQPLKFALLFSSLAAVLGGLGFASYAAANAALDAAVDRPDGPWLRWTAIDWEAWRFDTDAAGPAGIGAALTELALRPEQGMTVLDHVLDLPPGSRVVVSTGALDERIRNWSDPGAAVATEASARHARPNLRNAYVAPGSELERRVAGVWGELLGVDEVGAHDSFFELGGSSLLGLQVVQRLRRDLRIPVPLTVVYEAPTVAALAALLTPGAGAPPPAGDGS